jgi:hypothetical protein
MADKYNGKYPVAWTDAEVDAYIESGVEPAKTKNGVWVVDITRDEKDFVQWTVAEMFALYNGELISNYSAGDEAFLVALRVKARLSNAEAGKWSDDELYEWLVSGKEPEKTKSGNYKNDPERFTKDVHLLNDSELIDFGLGEFGDFDRSREYVLVEALDRFSLPLGTTFEDYAAYCKDRAQPPVATHGSLIRDRIRDGKLVSEWTNDELADWAVGEIGEGSLTVAELLVAAIKSVGGEWYWSKADVGAYLATGVLPEPGLVDLTAFHPAELLQFFRETGVEEAYDKWKKLCTVEKLSPAQVKATAPVDKIPEAWDSVALYTYADKSLFPVAYTENTWYNDVTREARIPNDLTAEEIEGCWHGKLHYTEDQQKAIIAKAAEDLRVHGDEKYADLYDDEAMWLYFDGIEPHVFEGLLVRSKTRDEMAVEEWTDAEVRAWLQDLIVTTKPINREELVTMRTLQWAGLADVATLEQWFIADSGPALTPNGVIVEDPRRCMDTVGNWSDAEVVALAHGWIKGLENVSEESLLAELAHRGLIKSSDWSLKQAVKFLTDGTEPVKTEFGNDRVKYDEFTITRKTDLKFYSDWANGKVKLPNSKAEVLNRVRSLIGASTASDVEIMQMLKAFKGDGSDGFKELPLHEQLKDGSAETLAKVIDLWDLTKGSSVENCLEAYEAMDKSTLARNDVLLVDPRRDMKAAYNWHLEELRAWARGEISPGQASDMASLCNALRKKISMIGIGWDNDSVKKFAATGETPALTSTGVLVVDLVRDLKFPTDWSDADLKAWAGGEIKTPVQVAADIMLTLRSRFKVPPSYNNQQMIQFVLTGEVPPEPEKTFTNAISATDNQIKAFLRREFELPADVAEVAFKEARARFKLDVHWTDVAIRDYYASGILPAKTSNGLYAVDRLRDVTSCAKWSYAEVEAFAKGEIKAIGIPAKSAAFVEKARVLISVEKGLPASKWSVDEVLTYLITGVPPKILVGNVFANDPIREAKLAASWSNDELKAWLREEIKASVKAPEADLWAVVYSRFQVPNAWYTVDARSYVLTGATVPSTPSGIWVRDRERDQRTAWTWTRAEVKAWARGQILPGLNAPEKDLVQQATICFNLSTSLSPDFIKEKVAAITEDTTPMTVSFVRDDLLSFAAGMKKEGADEVKAAGYQSMLNRCIVRVCALRGQDFVDGWTELLKFYFNQKNSIFTPGNLYNGVAMMNITAKQQKNFQHMTTILFNTCDPATREAAVKSRIDWGIALAGLPSDEARHQLLSFYNVN